MTDMNKLTYVTIEGIIKDKISSNLLDEIEYACYEYNAIHDGIYQCNVCMANLFITKVLITPVWITVFYNCSLCTYVHFSQWNSLEYIISDVCPLRKSTPIKGSFKLYNLYEQISLYQHR